MLIIYLWFSHIRLLSFEFSIKIKSYWLQLFYQISFKYIEKMAHVNATRKETKPIVNLFALLSIFLQELKGRIYFYSIIKSPKYAMQARGVCLWSQEKKKINEKSEQEE